MLRYLLILTLIFAWLAPAEAQDKTTDRQRDLLLRYGARLKAVDEKHEVFRRVCDLANPEQLEALDSLRVSPSQLESLLRVVQENLPGTGLDEQGLKELRRKVTPRFEEILGSEQFDILLELVPSPQQLEKVDQILAEAANSLEGRLAWEAANELRASLSAEQQRWLDPVLNLARPSSQAAAPPAAMPATASRAKPSERPERRLVFLKQTSTGEFYAETSPGFDYGLYLSRTYRVEGGDPAVLAAVSSAAGLPIRMLGTYEGDVLRVAGTSFIGPPPVLAIAGHNQVWRGRLPARAVSVSPPTVELDVGRGQRVPAQLEFGNLEEQQQFEQAAAGGQEFLLGATGLVSPEGTTTLIDLDFGNRAVSRAPLEASCLLQLSEEFLHHAAGEYLAGHQDQLSFGDQVRVQVSDLGLTLRDCQEHQLRLYGAASLAHTGLEVLEGQFEVLTQAEFTNGRLSLKPVPGSLQLRVAYPLFADMPRSWIQTLEQALGSEYAQGTTIQVPEQVRESVLSSGLLEAQQLDQLKLVTLPSADRRTSLLTVTAPAAAPSPDGAAAVAVDALSSRIEAPGEYAVAFSDQAVTAALRRKVPELLPIRREMPADLQENEGVRLTELEIPELDLAFADGLFQIRHCVVNVHWSWGLFSGVEPGIRFQGTARVLGSGEPFKLKALLQVQALEFLSERILERSPEEQQQLKDKLIKTMQDRELELSLPAEMPATVLSPRARWILTGIEGNPTPSELLLQGGLEP